MKKSKKKLWIWLAVAAVVIAAVVIWINGVRKQAAALVESMSVSTYTVERGTVETTATATGQLASADTLPVELPDGLKVQEVHVVAGDEVKTGDPLCLLDAATVQAQMIYEARQMIAADNRFTGPGTNDSIVSPSNARVKLIYGAEGDDVLTAMDKFGALAVLSTDGYMRLFLEDAGSLVAGDQVIVAWQAESGKQIDGVLRSWEAGKAKGRVERLDADGAGCTVLLPDSHAPYLADAEVSKDGVSVGSGTLIVNKPALIYGYGGEIDTVKCHQDESVSNGKVLFTLKNYPATSAFDLRYNERRVLADLYERLIDLYIDPVLKAPCDGIVSEVSVTEGALTGKAEKADKKNAAVTLAVGGVTKLTVNVDELDIATVKLGQEAEVTVDAMPGDTFAATVTRVARIAVKNNNSSAFPAELELVADDRLLAGMNATATIRSGMAADVLVIPIAAIHEDETGAYVTVQNTDGVTEERAIVTGLSDGTMAEVKEGLSQGEMLVYEEAGGLYGALAAAAGDTGVSATVTTTTTEG